MNSLRSDLHDKFEDEFRFKRRLGTMIRFLVFGVLVLSLALPGRRRARPLPNRLPRPMASIRLGKSKRSAIRSTWKSPGSTKLSRTWVWEPKTGQVTYEGKDKDGKPVKVTYVHSQLTGHSANVKDEIEPGFVNDQLLVDLPVPCLLGLQR